MTFLVFGQLPIKYLDSAHDRAVELVEDINALICAPLPDDEVPNKGHGTLKDPSSNNVITESSSTSIKMELVDPNEEFSSPTSLITAEDSFMGSIDADAHETESFSTKFPGLSLKKYVRLVRLLIQLFFLVICLSYLLPRKYFIRRGSYRSK